MSDVKWTPSLIEQRLIEAADVMKRLPDVRVTGHFNAWPNVLREFADLVEQEAQPLRRPPPPPDAISRMEETLAWLRWLEPDDLKILWLRANGERWKAVCWKVGISRTAANQRWLYAICLIAWRLNGRDPIRRRSRQHLIERVRAGS